MDLTKLKYHWVMIIKIIGCNGRAGGAATSLAGVLPAAGVGDSGSLTCSAKSNAPHQKETGLEILAFVIL